MILISYVVFRVNELKAIVLQTSEDVCFLGSAFNYLLGIAIHYLAGRGNAYLLAAGYVTFWCPLET